MPTCVIDGKTVEFKDGENLVDVAKRAGIEIPVFCYHPGLSVVAQCRMCAVEIEKMPKLQTACSTPAKEGMVVHTKSDRTKRNQESVMEFLLVNHPLDCPICDKAGECDLQDHSYKYGDANQRSLEDRRTYVDLDMGPVIKKNMNRCIHCTRCIRFGAEIAGVREMVAVSRGNNVEITTLDGRSLETDYAGNYADVCPTGSLTLKEFRFHKRAWMLKKTDTVCEGCSRGCNMELHHDGSIIYRSVPRVNMEINRYWLCDEGRFNYKYVHTPDRATEPMVKKGTALSPSSWQEVSDLGRNMMRGKKAVALVGTDLTVEEVKLLQEALPKIFSQVEFLHFGTAGVKTPKDDAPLDTILRMKSKTSNLHGIDKLGIKPLDGKIPSSDVLLVVRGGRAALPKNSDLQGSGAKVIGIGVFIGSERDAFDLILPGLTFAEKDGTIFNFEGREQKLKQAIKPPRNCKPLSETLMRLSQQPSKGVMSSVSGAA